jgi:hypothetical protein
MKKTDRGTEVERVRRHTSAQRLEAIEQQIERNVRFHGTRTKTEIGDRLNELEDEWSIERYLDTNASVIALGSAVLGVTANRKWLLLSAAVGGFLLQHAPMGWCPPMPVLRRLGVRTRSEIDREKFALKALRGDFKNVDLPDRAAEVSAAKGAVQAATA